MLYKVIALAGLSLAAAVPSAHPAQALQLAAVDPAATRGLCEACVSAEEVLVAAIGSHSDAVSHAGDMQVAHAAALEAQGAEETTHNAKVADTLAKKGIVEQLIAADEAAHAADNPDAIIDTTDALAAAAEAWDAAIKAEADQLAIVNTKKAESAVALTNANAADADVTAKLGTETASRADAATKCAAMRGETVAVITSTAAPVTAAPTTAAPVTAAPTTAAPVTAAPTTAAPTTAAPTTAADPYSAYYGGGGTTAAPKMSGLSHFSATQKKHHAAQVEAMYQKIKTERALAKYKKSARLAATAKKALRK